MSELTDNTSFISLHYALDLYAVVGRSRPTNSGAQSREEVFKTRGALRRPSAVNSDSDRRIIDLAHGL